MTVAKTTDGGKDRGIASLKHITTQEIEMVKKLSNTLVAMFRNLFESKSATEQYLAQSTDICDLEYRMKRIHATMGKFGI